MYTHVDGEPRDEIAARSRQNGRKQIEIVTGNEFHHNHIQMYK